MRGAGFEVLGSDPADDAVKPSGSVGRRDGSSRASRLAVLVTLAALVVGGVGGAVWARDRESNRQTAASQATFAIGAVVAAQVVPEKPHAERSSVFQTVDLAVVNAAPLPVSDVVVAWDAVHEAYSDPDTGRAKLDSLAPHEPQRVRLLLVRPCTTPALPGVATIPRLVVTAATQDGHRRQLSVDPLGLDQIWTGMSAACPSSDVTGLTTVSLTSVTPVGRLGADFTLTFTNASATDVLISGVILAKGFNTSDPQSPSRLQVFPHYSASLTVHLTITNCASAIQDIAPSTIRYVITNTDDDTDQRANAVTDTKYAEALGRLISRCAAS